VRNGFFFGERQAPFVLSAEDARAALCGSVGLRRNFTFNIQAFAFSAAFLARLREDGPVFRSPFPDYYLANVALAKSRRTVVQPAPMSIAGVSAASFGFTLFNNQEERGEQILNTHLASDPIYPEVEARLLPGPLYNTNYVVTNEHVSRHTRGFADCKVDFRRYRKLQVLALLTGPADRLVANRGSIWRRLSALEKIWTTMVFLLLRVSGILGLRDAVAALLQRVLSPYAFQPEQRILNRGGFSRLIQVFEAIQAGAFPETQRQ
jgi:hypothetical protein